MGGCEICVWAFVQLVHRPSMDALPCGAIRQIVPTVWFALAEGFKLVMQLVL